MAKLLTFLVGGNVGVVAGVYIAQQYNLPSIKDAANSLYGWVLSEADQYKA